VTNVSIGTTTTQVDSTKANERISFELCVTTTTNVYCGFNSAISTTTSKGIEGKSFNKDDNSESGCWDIRIGSKIDVYCALGLSDDTASDTINGIVIQTGAKPD